MTAIKVTLTTPIEHNGKSYSTLTFSELTTGHVALADLVKGEFSRMLAMMAGMSDTNLPLMQKLTMREFNRIIGEIAPMLGDFATQNGASAAPGGYQSGETMPADGQTS